MNSKVVSLCLSFLLLTRAAAQLLPNGSFELGVIPNVPSTFGIPLDPAVALPSWSIGMNQYTYDGTSWQRSTTIFPASLYYDVLALDSPCLAIWDSQSPLGVTPFHLNRSLLLEGGNGPGGSGFGVFSVSVWQTVSIPSTSHSVIFRGKGVGIFPGGIEVTVNGYLRTVSLLETLPNYNLYGVDVAGLAGESAEIKFTNVPRFPHGAPSPFVLDAVAFSNREIYDPLPLPEPTSLALVGLGGLLLVGRSLGRRKS